MNMILTIALVLALTVVGLEIRRRLRKRESGAGGGRYRSNRGPLSLDRQARPGKAGGNHSSSLAGPVFLGLVLAVLGFWMVAAYLFPEAEMPVASLEPVADAAPPEQFHVLAGRLSGDLAQPPAPGGSIALAAAGSAAGQTAPEAPLPPERGPATTGAQSMVPTQSRLGELGLELTSRPAKTSGKLAAQPQPPVRTAQAQPSQPRPPAAAEQPAPPARTNTAPAPAAGSFDQVDPSSVVAATSATPGSNPPPAVSPAPPVNSGRTFTVHLGSFSEQDNAEKYKNRLTGAGETAFISERTADGRLWFRVMSGRFGTRDEAKAHGLELKRRGLTADNGRFLVQAVDLN